MNATSKRGVRSMKIMSEHVHQQASSFVQKMKSVLAGSFVTQQKNDALEQGKVHKPANKTVIAARAKRVIASREPAFPTRQKTAQQTVIAKPPDTAAQQQNDVKSNLPTVVDKTVTAKKDSLANRIDVSRAVLPIANVRKDDVAIHKAKPVSQAVATTQSVPGPKSATQAKDSARQHQIHAPTTKIVSLE